MEKLAKKIYKNTGSLKDTATALGVSMQAVIYLIYADEKTKEKWLILNRHKKQ